MASRNLTLAPRNENTRDNPSPIPVKVFSIEEIEQHFIENVKSIEDKFAISSSLIEIGMLDEARDIFRTQIVFLESAFDFYMHEIVKLGITCMFDGVWNKTDKYYNLKIEMHYIERASQESANDYWLKDWIDKTYSLITLMSHEAFQDICKLIGLNIKNIADTSFYERNSNENTKNKLQNFLRDLYHRRNRIAHQSDRRMADAEIQHISEEDVKNYIDRMKLVVNAIGVEIRKKFQRE